MIAIGSDHAGFELKREILKFLSEGGYQFKDLGTYSNDSIDYPDIAYDVACSVARGEYTHGILICGTGIGMSIAANKVEGVRAAVCGDAYSARMAREHNDANILTLGARVIGSGTAVEIVKNWLQSEFQGGKHKIRVNKIIDIENRCFDEVEKVK